MFHVKQRKLVVWRFWGDALNRIADGWIHVGLRVIFSKRAFGEGFSDLSAGFGEYAHCGLTEPGHGGKSDVLKASRLLLALSRKGCGLIKNKRKVKKSIFVFFCVSFIEMLLRGRGI